MFHKENTICGSFFFFPFKKLQILQEHCWPYTYFKTIQTHSVHVAHYVQCEVSWKWRLLLQWASTAWQHVGIPMCVSCKHSPTQPPHPWGLEGWPTVRCCGAFFDSSPDDFCWILAHQPESSSTRKTIICLGSCRVEAVKGLTTGAALAKVCFVVCLFF